MSWNRWTVRTVLLIAIATSLVVTAGAASGHSSTSKTGAIDGATYKAYPFTGDLFAVKVATHGGSATFVGDFSYTDAGCKSRPSGNEFLTAKNAPRLKIKKNGAFSGSARIGAYLDKITGTFEGAQAPTTFTETIPACTGDRPQVFRFTMHTR